MPWAVLFIAAVAVAALLAAVTANLWILHVASPHISDSVETLPARRYAIVLGASVGEGNRPSRVLTERLALALAVYEAGRVRQVIVSGRSDASGYDEAAGMAHWLRTHGVPAADVIEDREGPRTLATMQRAATHFGVVDAVVVTTDFHLARSIFLARAAGIDAVGIGADGRELAHIGRYRVREILARTLAFIEA